MIMMERLKKYGRDVRWPVPVIQYFANGELRTPALDSVAVMSVPTVLNLKSIVDSFEGIERVWVEHRTWEDATDEMRAGMAAWLIDEITRQSREARRAVIMLYPTVDIEDPALPGMTLVRQYALTVPMIAEWKEL